MKPPIPVRNVYLLLCYAWNYLPGLGLVEAGRFEGLDPRNLLAYALARGVDDLARRGLGRSYTEDELEVTAVRGRISLGVALKAGRLCVPGRLPCTIDELNTDFLHNRIVATSLRMCLSYGKLARVVRREVEMAEARFRGVASVPLAPTLFRRVQLHRHNAMYGFLLNVCEMLLGLSTPEQAASGRLFRDVSEDNVEMARLFEAFVRNFYRLHLSGVSVSGERLAWNVEALTEGACEWLPAMHTDITLRTDEQVLIIDTKFFREPINTRRDGKKLRPEHLYQLQSYLANAAQNGGADARATGLLLYARVEESFRVDFRMGPNVVRVRSVDLAAPWEGIFGELLACVPEFAGS